VNSTPQKTTIPGRNLGRRFLVFEVEIVGDDLYCTNTKRVQMGLGPPGVSGDGWYPGIRPPWKFGSFGPQDLRQNHYPTSKNIQKYCFGLFGLHWM
jgi:hypothetical protein